MSKPQRACPEQATARRMGRMLIPLPFLLLASNLNEIRSIVPLGRAIFLMIPGTSDPGVWTFSCASSKRPTGEQKTAQG